MDLGTNSYCNPLICNDELLQTKISEKLKLKVLFFGTDSYRNPLILDDELVVLFKNK